MCNVLIISVEMRLVMHQLSIFYFSPEDILQNGILEALFFVLLCTSSWIYLYGRRPTVDQKFYEGFAKKTRILRTMSPFKVTSSSTPAKIPHFCYPSVTYFSISRGTLRNSDITLLISTNRVCNSPGISF